MKYIMFFILSFFVLNSNASNYESNISEINQPSTKVASNLEKEEVNLLYRFASMLVDMSQASETNLYWMKSQTGEILEKIDNTSLLNKEVLKKFVEDVNVDTKQNGLKSAYDILMTLISAPYYHPGAHVGLGNITEGKNDILSKKQAANLFLNLIKENNTNEQILKDYIYRYYPEFLPYDEAFRVFEEKVKKSPFHPIAKKILLTLATLPDGENLSNESETKQKAKGILFELAKEHEEALSDLITISINQKDWESILKVVEIRTNALNCLEFQKQGFIKFDPLINLTYDVFKKEALPLEIKYESVAPLMLRQLIKQGELGERDYNFLPISQTTYRLFQDILEDKSIFAQKFMDKLVKSYAKIIPDSRFEETEQLALSMINDLSKDETYEKYEENLSKAIVQKDRVYILNSFTENNEFKRTWKSVKSLESSLLKEFILFKELVLLHTFKNEEKFNEFSSTLRKNNMGVSLSLGEWERLMKGNIYPKQLIVGAGFSSQGFPVQTELCLTDFSVDIDEKRKPTMALDAFEVADLEKLQKLFKEKLESVLFEHVLSVVPQFIGDGGWLFEKDNIENIFQAYFSMLKPGGTLTYKSIVMDSNNLKYISCNNDTIEKKLAQTFNAIEKSGFKIKEKGLVSEPNYGSQNTKSSVSYHINLIKEEKK